MAEYQRGIAYCILIYLLLVVLWFAVPTHWNWTQRYEVLILDVGVVGSVLVFLLAMKVCPGFGIVLGILTLIPGVGLIVLLMINGLARNVLRRNGIAVGLLGVDPLEIEIPSADR